MNPEVSDGCAQCNGTGFVPTYATTTGERGQIICHHDGTFTVEAKPTVEPRIVRAEEIIKCCRDIHVYGATKEVVAKIIGALSEYDNSPPPQINQAVQAIHTKGQPHESTIPSRA